MRQRRAESMQERERGKQKDTRGDRRVERGKDRKTDRTKTYRKLKGREGAGERESGNIM